MKIRVESGQKEQTMEGGYSTSAEKSCNKKTISLKDVEKR